MPNNIAEKNICFCNSNLEWGGGETWHFYSAIYFAGRGCRVYVCCNDKSILWKKIAKLVLHWKDSNNERYDKIILKNLSFKNLSFLNPFKILKFRRFLKNHKITHLVLGMTADLKVGIFAASKIGISNKKNTFQKNDWLDDPSDENSDSPGSNKIKQTNRNSNIEVYYRRGSALAVKYSWLNKFLYSRLTGLIVNSKETGRCVIQNGRLIGKSNIYLLYNGIDISHFDKSISNFVGMPDSNKLPILGNAGRLSYQKGQKFLLYMSKELLERGFKHKLIIAGDGELKDELLSLATKLELSFSFGNESTLENSNASLIFTGHLESMSSFWNGIDIFILSSIWEGFGYVLAEAMLAQKPIIAFNINSIPELIQDGFNGALLPAPKDNEDWNIIGKRLADSVLKLWDDQELQRRYIVNGRKFCIDNFSQDQAMQKLEDIFLS